MSVVWAVVWTFVWVSLALGVAYWCAEVTRAKGWW